MATERRLFEVTEFRASSDPETSIDQTDASVVRVVPDVAGIDKLFDYAVPEALVDEVVVGTIVSVRLNGRTVEAWVVEVDLIADPAFTLLPILRVASRGPTSEVVELARWAATRWAGRYRAVLRSASAKRRVSHWPKERPHSVPAPVDPDPAMTKLVDDVQAGAALSGVVTGAAQPTLQVLRPLLADVGGALVIVPTTARARFFSGQLQRAGIRSHLYERQWEAGMSGGVVVGSRSSVWAPLAESTKLIVVVDEHDEALQEERNPTWHARDVAVERARRRGARCVLLSPCLSLAAREHVDQIHTLARKQQRANWPIIDLVDRKAEEPNRYGLFSPQSVQILREANSGLAILNRTGRSVMLACQQCGELVRSIDGQHLMVESDGQLHCKATGETRPLVCAVCTGTSLKRLRLGIGKAAEELAALMGEPISEVTGKEKNEPSTRIAIGTEAALYRIKRADVVVFLDFDQELLASRYLVAEQAMSLLVRACRLVGGRSKNPAGRVLIQTRVPEHRVLEAAAKADSPRMVDAEMAIRSALKLPPFGALAEVSKDGAAAYIASATDLVGLDVPRWPNVITMGPKPDGSYLLRAETAADLAELLAEVERPKERVRVAVDPPRA